MHTPGHKPTHNTPQATTSSTDAISISHTPKPTDSFFQQQRSLSLFAREESNPWINEQTCGWYPDGASEPFNCRSPLTCAIDPRSNIAGCASDATSSFYAVCLDYSAFSRGDCSDIDTRTGCCRTSSLGACGTYIFPGDGSPSMFMCFESSTAVKMLEVPRAVLEAAAASASAATTTATFITKTALAGRTTMTTTAKKVTSVTEELGIPAVTPVAVGGLGGKDYAIISLSLALATLIGMVILSWCMKRRSAKKAQQDVALSHYPQQ